MNRKMLFQVLAASIMGEIGSHEIRPKDNPEETGILTEADKAVIEKAVEKRARKIQKNIGKQISNTLHCG